MPPATPTRHPCGTPPARPTRATDQTGPPPSRARATPTAHPTGTAPTGPAPDPPQTAADPARNTADPPHQPHRTPPPHATAKPARRSCLELLVRSVVAPVRGVRTLHQAGGDVLQPGAHLREELHRVVAPWFVVLLERPAVVVVAPAVALGLQLAAQRREDRVHQFPYLLAGGRG